MRERRIMSNAKTAAARFASAEKAREEGDIRLASMLYLKVALTRPANPKTAAAKAALKELETQGNARVAEVKALLDNDDVLQAYEQFTLLYEEYEYVPGTGPEIKLSLNRIRGQRQYASVLNEAEAAKLWEVGRELEADDQMCCAFLIYEQARKLQPATSARRADERLKTMRADSALLASAQQCRALRECHKIFNTAELLAKTDPIKARDMFKEILAKADSESEVHVAAREQLAKLN